MEQYAKQVLGREKLETFIVPDIHQILDNLRTVKSHAALKSKSDIIDEFEHMVNWKRVFE